MYSSISMLGPIEMFVGLRRFGASASHPKNGDLIVFATIRKPSTVMSQLTPKMIIPVCRHVDGKLTVIIFKGA